MSEDQDEAARLIITVHGIRTFGQWQERLETLVNNDSENGKIDFANYKYGYFSVLAFIIPLFRWLVVRRFRNEMVALCEERSWSRIDLVGHSFGTHIIGWAVAGLPSESKIKIHTIILSGSVLRMGFPWHNLLGRRVQRLVNDCGTRDAVLLLSQFLVLFTGMAGRTGFSGATSAAFRNRYSEFGHSGYFQDSGGKPSNHYMRSHWLPLLETDAPIALFDHRKSGAFDGIVQVLANNAEPIKLTVYVTPFVLLSLWIYGLYAQALINESRFIARIASERIAEGDFGSAIAMLLEVIPDRQRSPLDERRYRPYSDEADAALNAAVSNFKSVQRLKGHTGLVQNVQFSSDGQHALTASDDGTVLFWNLGAKPTAHPIVSHDSSIPFGDLVNDATLSSDNQFIAVAQMGLAPRIWKAATGELVSSLDREDGKVWSIKFSPDNKRVVTGSDDGAVRVWNPATGEMITELAERGESVHFVTFSNDGQRIATASKDGIGRVYDAHDGSKSFELKGHTDVLRWVTFSADDKLIATASDDRSARIWDATTGHQVGILDGHKDRVQRVAFSHDGRRIMTASWDGRVRFWTWPDMNLWKVPEQWHTDSINSAMYSPDGRLVLSLSADRTARLWDSETGEVVGTVLGAPDVLIAGAFSPDGRKILIAGGSGYLSILSVDPASLITTFVGHRDYVRTATFSKDGSEVMSADDKSVVVWNVKTKKEVFHFLPGGDTVVGASYSHDGALILTSSFHAAQLWNARTGELIRTFDKHWSSDVMARLSPDDHSIATIGLNTIELWDTQTGANLKELGGPDDILPEIKYFAFSNDSQALVAGTENGAYLWDLNNPKPEVLGDADAEESVTVVAISHDGKKVALGELSGQVRGWDRASKRAYFSTGELVDGYVSVMQFTPDDKDLVVGFDTGDVKVLSAETGKVIFNFRGHKDKVLAIAVAKDSGTLVTASKDQTIKLWSLKSGLLLTTLVGHGDEINSIALCCDDNLLVSGSSDKTVRVWRLFRDLQALIVEARTLPFEKLDPSEKRLVFRR